MWPFIDVGLHYTNIQLLGDVEWGACLPYLDSFFF